MSVYKNFLKRFQHLPVAITGTALGVGGIGNCLALICNQKWITYITMSFVILFVLIILIRNIIHPKVLLWEIKEPLLLSLLPTFSMALMLISGFIAGFNINDKYSSNQIVGSIFMCIALLIQLIAITLFLKHLFLKHDWHNNPMFGSWFVPTVGLITACTVSGKFSLLPNEFFQSIWYLGYSFYVLTLPFITYSMLFKTKPTSEQFASSAVYFAPANLSPAGFIFTFALPYIDGKIQYYNESFINVLFIITTAVGFAFSLLLYIYVFRIFITSKFKPIFASVTFPCAIGATSMFVAYKYINQYIAKNNINFMFLNDLAWSFKIVSYIFATLASIIIFYILVRMFILVVKTLFTKNFDGKDHIAHTK